tara:strand:+ start:261 stop:575 length:315 start_codon:yes stop_codon:yes gene_type:complete
MGLVIGNDEAESEFKKRDVDGNGVLSFDEFAGYILEQFQSGTSESDVLNAFSSLAGGKGVISVNELNQYFAGEVKNLDYINSNMKGEDDAKDYTGFVKEVMFRI